MATLTTTYPPGAEAHSEALRPDTEERLPWPLAVLLMGGLSLGLWLVIWRVAELLLAS